MRVLEYRPPVPLLGITAVLTALIITLGLRARLGLGPALMVGIAGTLLGTSALALLCLDQDALEREPLLLGEALLLGAWTVAVLWLRRRWPALVREQVHAVPAWPIVLVLLTLGVGLRLYPSPYLHGGQDQGIYVNVGHHIARTGRLRPVDPLMAGEVPGIPAELIHAAHKITPLPAGSPLEGVREGRWNAGLHVEDASEGRILPSFFHLMPTAFALAELDLGFARSTWPLVLFALLSQLAMFALGYRITAGDTPGPVEHKRALAVAAIATIGLALHPLDLWISSFPVTENLARACLLGAAALGLEAHSLERRGRPGAVLLGTLAGLVFAAGAFTRGSMLALAIVFALALVLVRSETPRSRRALLIALVVGSTLAAMQGIVHSWPYFFSAASNHFHVPRILTYKAQAVAWAAVAGGSVLVLDLLLGRLRRRWPQLARTDRLARFLSAVALTLAAAAAVYRSVDGSDAYAFEQQLASVLLRYCGPIMLALGLGGVVLGLWRARGGALAWVLLGCAILPMIALKEGVRYEFYYARYLVGDAIPVLMLAAACALGEVLRLLSARRGRGFVWLAAAIALLSWHIPGLARLRHPVFWTRDLEHGPADLAALFEQVPDGAVLMFDAREPGRWRGILATPAFLSFGKTVLLYPNTAMVERAVTAGTPVYLLSGGWEAEDQQRWPTRGPWHTSVVARGVYRAQRAEIVEGGMPEQLTEWGGPWELQRIDPSIWRDAGTFSLHPGSRFIARADDGLLRSESLELHWPAGGFVELLVEPRQLDGCSVDATLNGISLPRIDSPTANRLRFALPAPNATPVMAELAIAWTCPQARAVTWRRLSVRGG